MSYYVQLQLFGDFLTVDIYLPATLCLPILMLWTLHVVIDTYVSDSLKQVLAYLRIPTQGHTFHAFRRSGAIGAFGSHVNLEDIKAQRCHFRVS